MNGENKVLRSNLNFKFILNDVNIIVYVAEVVNLLAAFSLF